MFNTDYLVYSRLLSGQQSFSYTHTDYTNEALIKYHTVKLEMFADMNLCKFVILKVFALLKFVILGLPKVNFVFPTNSVLSQTVYAHI